MSFAAAIFGVEGTRLTDWEKRFFAEVKPVGFIIFARNVESPAQLRRLTSEMREAVGYDAIVAVDQEGGRVQRLRAPHWREWVSPLAEVRRARNPERAMEIRYQIIASELRDVGIDVNAVPCADLIRRDTHPFLRNRCYSDDVDQVVAISKAVVRGCVAGGVLPILKHMPGHGLALVDSHLELPHVDLSRAELDQLDFAPFRSLSTVPMGMTAHVVFTGLGETRPATQSPSMINLIREDLGYDGLLMTDDIGMEALSGTVAERSRRALDAGCDIVLHSNGVWAEMEQVVAVAGELTLVAEQRARAALAVRHDPGDVDIRALEAEFRSLVG